MGLSSQNNETKEKSLQSTKKMKNFLGIRTSISWCKFDVKVMFSPILHVYFVSSFQVSVSLEYWLSPSNKITLKFLTSSCRQLPAPFLSIKFCFKLTAKDKTDCRLNQKIGGQSCSWLFWGEQKPQIAYSLFSGQKLIFGAMWVGFEAFFCFCFKAFGKKTLDFEILFSYVLAWETWPPTSTQSTLSTFIFNEVINWLT